MKKLGKMLGAGFLASALVAGALINPFDSGASKYGSLSKNKLTKVTNVQAANTEFKTMAQLHPEVTSDADIDMDILEEQLSAPIVTIKSESQVTKYIKKMNTRKSILYKDNFFKITEADNSDLKYFPKIDSQGSIGSCTAWATVYYQYTYAVNKALNRSAEDPNNVFSPTWVYNLINNGWNEGTYYGDALAVLSEVGAVPITKVPIVSEDDGTNLRNIHATKENYLEANKYKVSEFYNIDLKNREYDTVVHNNEDVDLDAIKKALVLGEILSATTYSDKWCRQYIESNQWVKENDKYIGESIITKCDAPSYGAHRITIVGFNDNIWVDINENGCIEKGEKGAFKIANSWGDYYDNDGFVWMSYDALNRVSSVKSSENVNLVSEDREAGLFDIMGFKVDVNESSRDVYLGLDLEAEVACEVSVAIDVKDKTTGESINTYNPVPFYYDNTFGGISCNSFAGTFEASKGEFYIDLTNAVPGITKDNLDNYDFEIIIGDDAGDYGISNPVTVHDVNFYIKSEDKTIDTALTSTKRLSTSSISIFHGSNNEVVEHEVPYSPEAVG